MTYKCINCEKIVKGKLGKNQMPICKKKKCIKWLAEILGGIIKNVDKELGNETDGFMMDKDLVRFNHFNADFEKHWKKMKK